MDPIFTENFLSHYSSDFSASSIVGIRDITLCIKSFAQELESGKLNSLKEEEIKSRFITGFFGDVLGFNYGNSNHWQLREEKKSAVDGKKADAALGYFFSNKEKDIVKAVIEIKDANADLDSKQNRKENQTPVEQAFSYVPKMKGTCKWVVVSNMIETRFYSANDISKFQVFFLKDILNEAKRNELLFLFHKDRFIIKEGESRTDMLLEKSKLFAAEKENPLHIIDKIHQRIKRFEGFGFVDPDYLAAIYPFNILNEHVWQYNNRDLFTINGEIYEFLKGITVENSQINFSEELQKEIEDANLIEAKQKLEYIFKFLNHSLVHQITAIKDYKKVEERNKRTIGFSIRNSFSFKEGEEGIRKDIHIVKSKECDCLSCNYRSLNFNRFLGKLKSAFGNEEFNTPEYAYGNYLAASNNFKTSYSIYKAIEKETKGKEGSEIVYFLTKQNIKYLHNLVLDYRYDDGKEILNDIKSVDLNKVIYDEIEFSVDREIKNYLVDVKENALIYKLQDEIEELTFEIEKLKNLYENGGVRHSGPNLPSNLCQTYFKLYLHINHNYIIYDKFKRYKSLTEKVFKGLITSYQTKKDGLTKLNEFFLTEAILHINPENLQKILKSVDVIKTDESCVTNLLTKLNNFTSSYYKDGFFGDPYKNDLLEEYLNNFRFKEVFTDIFSNLFTILSKLEVTKEQFQNSKKPLLNYLKIETELAWFDLKQFSKFLLQKDNLFETSELLEILKIAIEGDKYGFNKYTFLIETVAKVINKFYHDFKIDNVKLIQTAILKCSSDSGNNSNYRHLMPLVKVCADNCKQILLKTFEIKLDNKFNSEMYEELIEKAGYDWSLKNYFQVYSDYVNRSKGGRAYKYGKLKQTDLVFINYAYLVYKLNIDFEREELKSFTNLNSFESWLLNPFEFNYDNFDAKWLTDLNDPIFLNRLESNSKIKSAIEVELQNSFDATLAQIRFKHFTKN